MSQTNLFPDVIHFTVIPHESGDLAVMLARPDDVTVCLVGDVIQLEPDATDWGPLLCIVHEIKQTFVKCYALVPGPRSQPPGQMYMNVDHGKYWRLGKARWRAE